MKKPHAGGEIDAYCTKCRLDLNHRIVAMVGENVKQVECLTCRGTHSYRKPMAMREAEAKKKLDRPARALSKPKEAAAKTERNQKNIWEKSIAGKPPTAFRSYKLVDTYDEGELIKHSRFGDGVIYRVIDRTKVEVLFEDGPKTMAQGQ